MNATAVVWVVEWKNSADVWCPQQSFRDEEAAKAWLKHYFSRGPYRIARYVREESTPIESSPLTDEERKALTECEERET